MTFRVNSSAPTSHNLTHDIKIFPMHFGPAPARYWSTVFVVYRHDTERAQEWFSWDYMSTFLTNLRLQVCLAQRYSVPPNLAKRPLPTLKNVLAFITWCLFDHVIRNLLCLLCTMLLHIYHGYFLYQQPTLSQIASFKSTWKLTGSCHVASMWFVQMNHVTRSIPFRVVKSICKERM